MKSVKIGFAPTRRSIFSAPDAVKYANLTRERLKELGVEFVDITDINEEGLFYDEADREKIQEKFRRENVKGIFFPHGNFGTEYVCARLAKEMGLPVLLWGPRDERPDENGVRIARLDEMTYRRLLWDHRPLTDFWRVGPGYARKLEANGMFTMGDVARCSLGKSGEFHNEDLLYGLFGVNAELLIDHAWGYEPCTMADIKSYRPENNSIVSGQVLSCPYTFEKARLVIREMADLLALDLVEKRLVTDQIVLTVGYDIENLNDPARRKEYRGEVVTDRYGRRIPKHAHGTGNLDRQTSSAKLIIEKTLELYDRIMNRKLLIRRISLTANHLADESAVKEKTVYEQMDLFTDYAALEKEREKEQAALERERKMQKAVLDIRRKFGKNAILKGMNLEEGATARDRNGKIGGHQA